MTSMIKLLRALELLAGLDVAVPASIDLPIAQLEREQRKLRRRARGRHARRGTPPAPPGEKQWKWGEERGPDR